LVDTNTSFKKLLFILLSLKKEGNQAEGGGM
jgi:hypothetical protein